MEKVILFTNASSVHRHWDNALASKYDRIHLDSEAGLLEYLNLNPSEAIAMIDELSVKNIQETLKALSFFSHVTILLFNSIPEARHASNLIGGNVKGYENSFLAPINLLNMLSVVKNGKNWLFEDLTYYIINKYIDGQSKSEPEFIKELTGKEKDIALMIADGLSNKDISSALKCALSTVKGHVGKIFEKAGVSDRFSLALKFK